MQEWINLLTENKNHKIQEFEEIKRHSKSDMLAIMEYRRLEHSRNRGCHIVKVDNSLDTLQELFLEPLTQSAIHKLDSKIKSLKMSYKEGYKKIYQMHLLNKGNRFIYLVNVLGN